jgi:murein DD-endopeptidase MepM/ murein hydrolase activator NlpD
MKKVFLVAILVIIPLLVIGYNFSIINRSEEVTSEEAKYKEIHGTINKGETLFDIFKKYRLGIEELFKLREASADIHRLRELSPGQPYKIVIDDNNQINTFIYWIDDDSILNITRTESGYCAEKKSVAYEKRIHRIGGLIKDNLISSIGEDRENLMLAIQLSDIFAWDIDFTTDLRKGDIFKIVVEGLYLDEEFKKYGEILSAEFTNNGKTYRAYKFEYNGETDYYDEEGKSLKKTFLKAPLSFRRISSGFSNRRYHPILKIYRPHQGLDYAAPAGTPVSATGNGIITFAGYKKQYGKLVIIKHSNGWKTYYGHLLKIAKGIRKGVKVEQDHVIGYVGATGLATGPHLHYEMRVNKKPVNPLTIKSVQGKFIPNKLIADFRNFRDGMDTQLASITPPTFVLAKNKDI